MILDYLYIHSSMGYKKPITNKYLLIYKYIKCFEHITEMCIISIDPDTFHFRLDVQGNYYFNSGRSSESPTLLNFDGIF